MCSQNAANAISGIQILKFFWWGGEKPPDPPTNLVPSALAPPQKKILQSFCHWSWSWCCTDISIYTPLKLVFIHVTGMLPSDKLPIFFLTHV